MIIRELLTRLGFETDTEPLKRVEESLDSIRHRIEFLAAAEITKKLYEVSERFSQWGHNLVIMADTVGVTTDELQRLQFAAEKNGVSAEAMGHSLAHLSRHLYEAKNGSKEASEAFLKAGFTSEQIDQFKTSEDALMALSDRLAGMPDHVARVAVAQELLGRGGFKLAFMLGQGSKALREQGNEAQRLGLILSGGQVSALEQAAHAFQRFESLLRAIGGQIAAYIAPAFAVVTDKLIDFYGRNRDIIGLNFTTWLEGVAYAIGFVAGLFVGATERVIEFAKSINHAGDILKIFMRTSGIVTGLWVVVKVIRILAAVFGALLSPITGAIGAISAFVGAEGLGAIILISGGVLAALAAITLGIQDIWAHSRGEASWLDDLRSGLAAFIDSTLPALLASMREKAKGLALSIGDFIETDLPAIEERFKGMGEALGKKIVEALSTTNWAKVWDDILIGLGAMFSAAAIPFKIGASIAEGVVTGLLTEMRARAPKLMEFLFPEGGEKTDAAKEEIYKKYPQLRKAEEATAAGGFSYNPPTLESLKPAMGNSAVIHMHNTINVPAGTNSVHVEAAVHKATTDFWDKTLRETDRSLQNPKAR